MITTAFDEPMVPLSIFADRPLRLSPDDYPNELWTSQRATYDLCWNYYRGYVLNKKAGDKKSLLYPVKLNIVRSAVINHAAVLLGQFEDDSIVQFGLKSSESIKDDVRTETTKMLNFLWTTNDGDELLMEQSLYQQIFGGCFWKIAWTPTRKAWPIRYFTIDPRAAYPVWDGNDLNRLVSMDVQYQIPRPTAVARFRAEMPVTDTPEYVTVHEHWDEAEYFIRVDNQMGKWPDGSEMAGINPFLDPVLGRTVIPYVYSPRYRVGDGIYGEPLPPALVGPQNETNNNLAHLNEGLADAMHQQPWVRNRPKGTQGLTKPRNEFLDLGMGQHGQHDPEVGRLAGADITPAMIKLVTEDLIRLSREHINLPDVAWGRTDASVRSALTLKFMLWPTINLGMRYRKHMATGFKYMNYTALVMALAKRKISQSLNGVESLGIGAVREEMIEAVLLGHKTNWPPMLPDDRSELVAETVQRLSSGTLSVETSVRRLDGPDELKEELARIEADALKKQAEQVAMLEKQAELAPKPAPGAPGAKAPKAGGAKKKKAPGDTTTKAQAAGGRAKNSGA